MKKQRSLGTKMTIMMMVLGLVAILITIANCSALNIIKKNNQDIASTFVKYEEAVQLGDSAMMESAQKEMESLMRFPDSRRCNFIGTYIRGYTYLFDGLFYFEF